MKVNLIHITPKDNLSSIMKHGIKRYEVREDHARCFSRLLKKFDGRVIYFMDDDLDSMKDFTHFKFLRDGIIDFAILECKVKRENLIQEGSFYSKYSWGSERKKYVMCKGEIPACDIKVKESLVAL
jgi:hypothetical protein